jgi:hypothetical protein
MNASTSAADHCHASRVCPFLLGLPEQPNLPDLKG